jgi:hypothetical protein
MIKIGKSAKITIIFAVAFVIIITFFLLQDLYELYLIERIEFLLNLKLEALYDYRTNNNFYDEDLEPFSEESSVDLALDMEMDRVRRELNILYDRVKLVESNVIAKTNILFVCIVLFTALAISIGIYFKDRELIKVRKKHTHTHRL